MTHEKIFLNYSYAQGHICVILWYFEACLWETFEILSITLYHSFEMTNSVSKRCLYYYWSTLYVLKEWTPEKWKYDSVFKLVYILIQVASVGVRRFYFENWLSLKEYLNICDDGQFDRARCSAAKLQLVLFIFNYIYHILTFIFLF